MVLLILCPLVFGKLHFVLISVGVKNHHRVTAEEQARGVVAYLVGETSTRMLAGLARHAPATLV